MPKIRMFFKYCVLIFQCMQLWEITNLSSSQYSLRKLYYCNPRVPGTNSLTMLHYRWSNCPLSDPAHNDACGPVDPAPFDNRSYVAVVPCTRDCSLKEKALNLGQANYVVFITWEGGNCSGSELIHEMSCVMRHH